MDEKIETSSEQAASISGLPGEKRDGDDSDELGSKRAKLQHLDSDAKSNNLQSDNNIGAESLGRVVREEEVLANDVKTSTSLPKATSVSEDDDRLVAGTVKGVSNCETRGVHVDAVSKDSNFETLGVHVDAVSKNRNVLKPRGEVTESVVSPGDASDLDPISGKADTFQMGSLGKSDSMRRWMEMKRNGFLSGPLGTPSSEVAAQKQPKSSKRRGDSSKKSNEVPKKVVDRFSNVAAPSGLLTELKPGIIRHVRSKEHVWSALEALIRNATDLNVRDSATQGRALASTLPSTTEQAKSLAAVEAASVASQWLEFLHQDLSERLSAVQDSRNRVDDTLKAELPLLITSKESTANQKSTSGDKTVTEAHQMKWSAKFDEFKKALHDEEKDLERSLNQVKDMQSRCNEGLRQMNESSCGKDGTNQETSLAVQAAAASIYSTCRLLVSMMKPKPPPNNS